MAGLGNVDINGDIYWTGHNSFGGNKGKCEGLDKKNIFHVDENWDEKQLKNDIFTFC